MVMVWSAMVFWNSMFSFCRSLVAFCKSICTCLICLFAESISSAMVVVALSSSAILASRDSFWDVVFSIVSSLSWSSALHQSFFFTSSACCCPNILSISSMLFLTFTKASNSTDDTNNAKSKLPDLRPTFLSKAATFERRLLRLWVETCTKLRAPLMASRASSPCKISTVSETACISARRLCLRCWKSASPLAHISFKFFRNTSSAAKTFFSSSMSSLASARVLSVLASSSSFCSSIFSASAICVVLAFRSSAKAAARSCSIFWASARAPPISSSNCFSTPKISPLCEV
mmetsp:Transcript_65889/g.166919  ORF Transcript_65889/g.166919 Transcript_65889/m.166919 type:complete len:289 (+) Transcript_65889:574-1440(+)